ncbi:MAG: hypothetical protein DCC67_17250 [Planctomycetota bacterium]|nr:MAG: hypothetical protein DCC67_17250 [Planctomycetota bacterium]
MPYGWGWKPYVSVAERRAKAKRHVAKLATKGRQVLPVEISGRKIAATFWGAAWCDNLERYSDFANRLPRGRTYVRNGSVIDLQIKRGCVTAIVSGSEIYEVKIDVTPLAKTCWKSIKSDCARSIDSLIDLLQGRFSKGVMERLTRQEGGLFPKPREISMRCSCPDWAVLCKHAAAALYGVGARLDSAPELLFLLRGVDHLDLISQAVDGANLNAALASDSDESLVADDLGAVFGIDLESLDAPSRKKPTRSAGARRTKPARAATKTVKAAAKATQRGGATAAAKRAAKKKTPAKKQTAAQAARRPKKT